MGSLTRKIARHQRGKIKHPRSPMADYIPPFVPPVPMISPHVCQPGETPEQCARRGVGYTGPKMEDKGKKDGSCNRSACQMPLRNRPQWYMRDHMSGGRLYYCEPCAMKFHEADRQFGEPLRCTLDTDTEEAA